jgi:hypothetical protein
MIRARKVARQVQEHIFKTLGEPPPGADAGGDRTACPDPRGAGRGPGCP